MSETQAAVPEPPPITEAELRVAEALVFAHAGPVSRRALAAVVPDWTDVEALSAALIARWAGRGVEIVAVAEGLMARTAADVAPAIRKVIEIPRRLPRAAMEALAVIAYHQPVTRAEIEDIRGASLAQTTLETLLENNLIAPRGKKESPGRPTLWGTTPAFLAQFGLGALSDLPKREELLTETPSLPFMDAAPGVEPTEPEAEPASPPAAS